MQETDFVNMIRSQRFFHMALESLLDPETHKRLQTRCKVLKVDMPEVVRFSNT